MNCPDTDKPCATTPVCATACVEKMRGMFRQPVGDDPVSGVIGGYAKGNGPECSQCKSRDTEAISRDPVWEETECRCNSCGHHFTRG